METRKNPENKYHNGKIYKLISEQTDQIYIGSTIQKLSERRCQHIKDYKFYSNGTNNNYITSFEIVKHPDFQIVLIETVKCENKKELYARERHWIENSPECVNKIVPGRTHKEYLEDHKEEIKKYNEDNKDHHKKYLKDNKAKVQAYKTKHYQNNKDKIKARSKKSREENKAKLNQKFLCECGGKYKYCAKAQHFKTKLHQNWMAQNNIVN